MNGYKLDYNENSIFEKTGQSVLYRFCASPILIFTLTMKIKRLWLRYCVRSLKREVMHLIMRK